jgi:hypothetical protein
MSGYSSFDNMAYFGWFTFEMELDCRKSNCLHGDGILVVLS